MSGSATGILAYGYDLGGMEDWRVRETGPHGQLLVPWYDQDAGDFAGQATRVLRAAVGFTETWEARARDGYLDRERAADQRAGAGVREYCTGGYPLYVLCALRGTATAGPGHVTDVTAMVGAGRAAHDVRLAWALGELGLTPVQERPAWLLCSYSGGL